MCFINRAPILVHIISTSTSPPLATSQSGKKRLLTICCCYVKHKASARVVSGKKYLSGLSSCLGASGCLASTWVQHLVVGSNEFFPSSYLWGLCSRGCFFKEMYLNSKFRTLNLILDSGELILKTQPHSWGFAFCMDDLKV